MLDIGVSPWPSFTQEEAEAVRRVLLSNKVNYWTGGECRSFEQEFALFSQTKHAIALANGTVALEVALRALNIGVGDEVIVSPRTFIASASCIVTVGATPVFADVDKDSQNITAATIAKALTKRTRAVICVHLAGLACDMDPIMEIARKNKIYVVEDCAQAHGAKYKGNPVGSIGDIGAWSFCQDKIMSTGGEGGMVATQDSELWSRMWSYKDHGKSWSAVYKRQHAPGFRWLHESFGSNYRMTEIQAAIGRVQLRRLPDWVRTRQNNARKILQACKKYSAMRVFIPPDLYEHAYYKVYAFVRAETLKSTWDRDRVIAEIAGKGVPCLAGSCSEIYLERAFDDIVWLPGKRLPVAHELGQTSLMFLVHPTISDQEIDKTCHAIEEVMESAGL